MREQDWEAFFDILGKIMQLEGSWQEKKAQVKLWAERCDELTNLEELAGWFADE